MSEDAATPGRPRVEIVTDQKAGAVRFVIDGKDVAIIDAAGLQVRESIEFGGTLTDAGTAHFDDYVARLKAADAQ